MDQDIKEVQDSEVIDIYGRCRCCLELGYVKNMWSEYSYDGAQEIYGEMLMETFSVAWDSSSNDNEQICHMCVDRLRDAYMFKREMLASDQILKEGVTDTTSVKEERLSDLDQYENTTEHVIEDADYKVELKGEGETEADEEPEVEYEEVEYLEDEIPPEMDIQDITGESSQQARSEKRPKRHRIHGVNMRNYKNYSEERLRQSVEAALSSTAPLSEVAAAFGVPRKTLTARVYSAKHRPKPETPRELDKLQSQENHFRFVQEIKKVLSYTNAIPFKIKSGRYYCAYCYTTYESFEYASDLRIHTLEHEKERVRRLDQILRPQFLNEILRVDIDRLQCTECSIPLKTWNHMFEHLHEKHDTQLDLAYTKLIPYKLKSQSVVCALCNEEFSVFQFLDTHMNAHFCNYMCSECGDTFVTENRLKHHATTHNVGKHPCRYCGKVFTLEKYKKKHEGMVHKDAKLFKCVDCNEAFHSEYERHVHVLANHKERIRISTCEVCGKSFDWKPYYLAHMRKVHHKVKKFACTFCNKAFPTNHEVRNHELRHTGGGKHRCTLCNKRFVTLTELRKHCRKHVKEMRYVDEDEIKNTSLSELILGE